MVTFIYAFVGTALSTCIGLGLAVLTIQRLRRPALLPGRLPAAADHHPGRRRLHVPDAHRHPARARSPRSVAAAGMADFALLGDPWGARIAVIISDVWQWIPFMYIVLLAALEGRDLETEEAALGGRCRAWQIFLHITLPALIPVSATVILIRMIEAFKIIDLPNVLTNGGPGTATESVTLAVVHDLAGFNLGSSAAVAYTLLIVVTMVAIGLRDDWSSRRTHARSEGEACRCDEESAPQALGARPVAAAKVVGYVIPHRWAFIVLFPLYWLAITSFKLPVQFSGWYRSTFPFLDFQPTSTTGSYILVDHWSDTVRPFFNTIIVGAHAARRSRSSWGSLAAYGLVRFRYRPRIGVIGSGIVRDPAACSWPSALGVAADPRAGCRRSRSCSSCLQSVGQRFRAHPGQ